MTGPALAEIMGIPEIVSALFKAARRYASCLQDQEEYVQDGWLRIGQACEDGDSFPDMMDEAKRGMEAAYRRKIYRVEKKTSTFLHGKNRESCLKSDLKHLYRNKYVKIKPEKLDSWYYEPEWADLGLERSDCSVRLWHQIIQDES